MKYGIISRGGKPYRAKSHVIYGVQDINGKYVTVENASRRLVLTPQGVRARIRKGQLPAIKIADMWFIKASDLARCVIDDEY